MDDFKLVRRRRPPGRPAGSLNKLARATREMASLTGKLPHEILLGIARGEPITVQRLDASSGQWLPELHAVDVEMVIDAAGKAAPYFAPKIATVEVIQGLNNAALDDIIKRAAADAGISLGIDGEGEEEEGADGTGEDAGHAPGARSDLEQLGDAAEAASPLRRRS